MPQAFLAAPRLPHLEPLPVPQKPPCALAALSFYDLPKLLFWHLQMLVRSRSASSSNASDFSCSTSPAAPRALACASEATVCLGRTLFLWPSETALWHLETLVRSRSASSSNASGFSSSTSPAAPRTFACCSEATVCLGRTLFLWPSETAFWHLQMLVRSRSASSSNASDFSCSTSPAAPRALACASEATVCLGPTLFFWPSETAFWHLQMLVRSRSAFSSNASGFSCSTSPAAPRALACASVATVCLGRTLFLWPSETAFWHLQMLVRSRSASSSNASDFSCSTSSAAPRALACASEATVCLGRTLFLDLPKLLFGTFKCL